MSIYFTISTNSIEEAEALESEGAPWVNMGNGAGQLVASWFYGEPVDVDKYAGTLEPAEALERSDEALTQARHMDILDGPKWVLTPDGGEWEPYFTRKVERVIEVLRAAQALGRTVTYC